MRNKRDNAFRAHSKHSANISYSYICVCFVFVFTCSILVLILMPLLECMAKGDMHKLIRYKCVSLQGL